MATTDLLNTILVGGAETVIMVATVVTIRLSSKKDKKAEKKAAQEVHDAAVKEKEQDKAAFAALVTTVSAIGVQLNKVDTKLEKETGDNNNGFRQKLNEHSAFVKTQFEQINETTSKIEQKTDRVDEKTDKAIEGLAELRGAFNERTRTRQRGGLSA